MITLDQLTELLGWVSVINITIYLFTVFLLTVFKIPISAIHNRIFDIKAEHLPLIYLAYIAVYKILIVIFAIVPYLALKIMGF